jgi:hypothetical protein
MIKIVLLILLAAALPSGVVAARLLYRWGNLKLKALEDKQWRDYLDEMQRRHDKDESI